MGFKSMFHGLRHVHVVTGCSFTLTAKVFGRVIQQFKLNFRENFIIGVFFHYFIKQVFLKGHKFLSFEYG